MKTSFQLSGSNDGAKSCLYGILEGLEYVYRCTFHQVLANGDLLFLQHDAEARATKSTCLILDMLTSSRKAHALSLHGSHNDSRVGFKKPAPLKLIFQSSTQAFARASINLNVYFLRLIYPHLVSILKPSWIYELALPPRRFSSL